jgi:hypothetical protein
VQQPGDTRATIVEEPKSGTWRTAGPAWRPEWLASGLIHVPYSCRNTPNQGHHAGSDIKGFMRGLEIVKLFFPVLPAAAVTDIPYLGPLLPLSGGNAQQHGI